MLIKNYARTGRVCRVTFKLPPEPAAGTVSLCGDFNDWDPDDGIMERAHDGSFVLSWMLHPGRRYHFRYLINGRQWRVDDEADGFDTSAVGIPDAVIEI